MSRVACLLIAAALLWPTPARSDEAVKKNGPSKKNEPAASLPAEEPRRHQWPSWRGPLQTGVAPHGTPPVEWSETQNVRWKIELPGHGHATPVIWGEHLFLTAAAPTGEGFEPVMAEAPGAHDNAPVTHKHDYLVLAVDRSTGDIAWQKTVRSEVPWQGMHRSGSYASPSPVTDGEVVVASFGSQGVHALDAGGKMLWQRDFGRMRVKHAHGEGSSLALYGDSVLVVWDHEGPSFLAALDRRTGQDRWKVERDQGTSWASPLVAEMSDGRAQVVVAGTGYLRGHDLETGRELWRAGGLSANVVATPVFADGRVFAGSSYEHQIFFAVDLDGIEGKNPAEDLTGTDRVLWSRRRGTPYVPSPLLYDDVLYFHNHYQSVLSRVAASDGQDVPGPIRLPIRNVYGSPVAADGRVYVTDLEGTTAVLSHENPPRLLARNQLDERFASSAALAGDAIFLRGERFLYCLARPSAAPETAGTLSRDASESASSRRDSPR